MAGVLPSAWAEDRPSAPQQTIAPPATPRLEFAGGALLWRAEPNPLPVPRAATVALPYEIAVLVAWILGVYALLAMALGWRARRRLVTLSAPLETT